MLTPETLTDERLRALRLQFKDRDREMYALVCLCGWGNQMLPTDVAYKARVKLCGILDARAKEVDRG